MCAIGGNIRVSAADTVVQTCGSVDIDVELRIIGIGEVGAVEVGLDMAVLISGAREVVGEAACGGEVDCSAAEVVEHHDFGVVDCAIGRELRTPNGSYVWAAGGVLRVEYCFLRAETAVRGAISGEGSYTVVTGCEKDRYTLEAELHELIALTAGIGCG